MACCLPCRRRVRVPKVVCLGFPPGDGVFHLLAQRAPEDPVPPTTWPKEFIEERPVRARLVTHGDLRDWILEHFDIDAILPGFTNNTVYHLFRAPPQQWMSGKRSYFIATLPMQILLYSAPSGGVERGVVFEYAASWTSE